MLNRRQFVTQLAVGASLSGGLAARTLGWSLSPVTENYAAATVHPLATQAAMEILDEGGNAIDAAIAAALVLGVVDGHNSGIGGGTLVLLRLADGRLRAIDGRETAGRLATPDRYVRDGKPATELSQTGALASGVPGQIAAMHRMHHAHGQLPWHRLFRHAIDAAEQGFIVGRATAKTIAAEAEDLARFPASRAVFLGFQGKGPEVGDRLVQKDLATTLQQIATQGADWFYGDGFATPCCQYLASIGGILQRDDFARYQAIDRTPIITPYRGFKVVGFPPPSSGGLHIAQMLRMLSQYPLEEYFRTQPALAYHLIAECMKRAFADRAYWLGDSDFVTIPSGLLDPAYLHARIADFSESRATSGISHGLPMMDETIHHAEAIDANQEKKHTTHLTVADAMGNWVAMTCTINTSWGSKVVIPGTGVMMNNEMDDFSLAPGVPNAFGLVGSAANAIAPGKRPLSSMSPTIVLDPDGAPRLTCGAAGGPRIINATLQVLIRCLDLKQTIPDAIAAPRIHHQWRPDTLFIAPPKGADFPFGLTAETSEKLAKFGHVVRETSSLAVAQGIERRDGRLVAAHDPRADGASSNEKPRKS